MAKGVPDFNDLGSDTADVLVADGWKHTGVSNVGFWTVTQLSKGNSAVDVYNTIGANQDRVWLKPAKGASKAMNSALGVLEAASIAPAERRADGVRLVRLQRRSRAKANPITDAKPNPGPTLKAAALKAPPAFKANPNSRKTMAKHNAPRLTANDKTVIESFTEQRPLEGRKYSTDGRRLDGLYMGGNNLAVWSQNRIVTSDPATKTHEMVHRYIRKITPRNLLFDQSSRRNAPGDQIAARELVITTDNDYELRMRRRPEFILNMVRKMNRGTFDPNKAVKLWEYYAKEAADSYAREHGSPGDTGARLFDKPTRQLAAVEFYEDAIEEVQEAGGPAQWKAQNFPDRRNSPLSARENFTKPRHALLATESAKQLAYLRKARDRNEAKGNTIAVKALDSVIDMVSGDLSAHVDSQRNFNKVLDDAKIQSEDYAALARRNPGAHSPRRNSPGDRKWHREKQASGRTIYVKSQPGRGTCYIIPYKPRLSRMAREAAASYEEQVKQKVPKGTKWLSLYQSIGRNDYLYGAHKNLQTAKRRCDQLHGIGSKKNPPKKRRKFTIQVKPSTRAKVQRIPLPKGADAKRVGGKVVHRSVSFSGGKPKLLKSYTVSTAAGLSLGRYSTKAAALRRAKA